MPHEARTWGTSHGTTGFSSPKDSFWKCHFLCCLWGQAALRWGGTGGVDKRSKVLKRLRFVKKGGSRKVCQERPGPGKARLRACVHAPHAPASCTPGALGDCIQPHSFYHHFHGSIPHLNLRSPHLSLDLQACTASRSTTCHLHPAVKQASRIQRA